MIPQTDKRLHHFADFSLPCESQAGGNCNGERMLRAVGLEAAAIRDIVLYAWLSKDADAGRDIVLNADANAR